MSMKFILKYLFISFISLLLSGCGGSGVSDSNSPINKQNPTPIPSILSGVASKGPIRNGTVNAYSVVNGQKGELLSSTQTDLEGKYSLSLFNYSGPVLIDVVGGSYKDEATGLTKSLSKKLQSLVPSLKLKETAHITPLTHMAVKLLEKKASITTNSIQDSLNQISNLYSIANLLETTPIDPSSNINTNVSSAQAQYGFILSGFSQLGKNLSTDPLEVLEILSQDASDGKLDGKSDGIILSFQNKELSPTLGTAQLSEAITQFSTSSQNITTFVPDTQLIINLQTSNGDVSDASVKLTINTFPKITKNNSFTLSGSTFPGNATLQVFQNDQLKSSIISNSEGIFSLSVFLLSNQTNSFTIKVISGLNQTQRNISILQHSNAPTLSILNPLSTFINTNSISLSYTLTSLYASPFVLTATHSSGVLTITSNFIHLSNVLDGFSEIQLRFSDQLGNFSNRTISFTVDTINPTIVTTVATWFNQDTLQAITFSEILTNVSYSFVRSNFIDNFISIQEPYNIALSFQNIDGSYRLVFRGNDLAGNNLDTNLQIIQFDHTLPNFISLPTLPNTTNSSIFQFNYTTDSATTIASLSIKKPDLSIQNIGVLTDPFQNISLTNPSDGTYIFNFSLNDFANNQSTYTSSVILDLTKPNPPSLSTNNVLTNSTQITINASKENQSTLRYFNLLSPTNFLFSNTSNVVINSIPTNQTSTYCFQDIDLANNISDCNNLQITQDSQAILYQTQISANSNTPFLNSTNIIQVKVISSQVELGSTISCVFLSKNYGFISTDSQNFNLSILVSDHLTNSEINPNLQVFTSDLAKNSISSNHLITYIIDTVFPAFQSVTYNATQTYVGLNKTISVTIAMSNNEVDGVLNHSSNFPLNFTNSGGFYSSQFTVLSTQQQSYPNLFTIPLTYIDKAGNQTSLLSTSSLIIDTTPPIIDLIDNTALQTSNFKIGDSISFEISLRQSEPNLQIFSTFNSVPLSFIAQTNSQSYKATYIVSQSNPLLIATSANFVLSSVFDQAGNTASIDLNKISTNNAIIDNRKPIISNLFISHPPTNSLTLNQVVSFVISLDSSVENTFSATNVTINASYNSQQLNFITSPQNIYSKIATYIVTRGSINQASPVNFTYQAIDSFSNSSILSSYLTTFTIDSQIPILGDFSLFKTSNKTSIITSDIVTLKFSYNTLPSISSISGDVLLGANSDSLTFLSTSNPSIFISTWAVPSAGLITDQLTIQNVIITENSGNQSTASTAHLTSSFNSNLSKVDLLIDTLAPIISSITANHNNSTTFAINDTITFSFNPSIIETGLSLSLDFNGFSLNATSNTSGSTYSASYTLLETHTSNKTGANLTNVIFTDSNLLSGPSSSNNSFNFILDSNKPVLASISTTATKVSTLILNDKIFFSVMPTLASSDTTSIAAWFNSVTLTFIPSSAPNTFVSTYTVLSTHSDWLSTSAHPQLSLILTDSAGNSSSLTQSTTMAYYIDAHLPIVSILSYSPSAVTTFVIGSNLNFSFDVLSSADTNLSVTGTYLTSNLQFFSNILGTQYQSTFSFLANTNTTIPPELTLTISDAAGNSLTTQTTGLINNHTDLTRPILNAVTSEGMTQNASQIGVNQSIRFSVAVSNTSTSGGIDPLAYIQANYKGQTLSFSSTDNGFNYFAFYTTNASTPSTSALENITTVLAYDLSGNSSLMLTGSDMAFSIDTILPGIQSVSFTPSVTPLLDLTLGSSVTFTITPSASSIDTISASGTFNSTAINFVSSGNTYVGTYTVTSGHDDQLYNLVAFPQLFAWLNDDAGNRSNNYASTDMELFIDAKSEPIIVSATSIFSTSGTANETHLKIGDSIEFLLTLTNTFTATPAQIISTYHGTSLHFSLASSSTTIYTTTYIVSESNPKLQGVSATYTLSYETSFSSKTTLLDFTNLYFNRNTIDNRKPVLTSISTTATKLSTLILNDEIYFSVSPDLTSSDTSSVSGWFNSVTLTFVASSTPNVFSSTYTLLSTHSDWLNTSIFSQLSLFLTDASGNSSDLTQTTTMAYYLDAHPPTISILSYSPSSFTTFKIGSLLNFSFDVLSSADKNLSVTGIYLTSNLQFFSNSSGTNYLSTYAFVQSPSTTNIAPDLSITVSDPSGNTITTQTTGLINDIINVSRPLISNLTSSFNFTVGALPNTTTHLKIGDSVFFSVTLSTESTTDFDHLSASYNGINLSFSQESMSSATYIATYTLAEGQTTQTSTLAILDLYAYDTATNASVVATSMLTRIIDTSRPSIVSVTSSSIVTPSYIELNEQLLFSVNSLESGGTVTASYNGVTLSWAELISFPGTYSTTYTALLTHSDHVTPLQITGVLLYDLAGNASAISSSIDVNKSIDINIPMTPTISPESLITNNNPLAITVNGSQSLDLYVNDLFQSTIGVSGTTQYNASLVGTDINTFSFIFKDSLGKPSATKLGYYQFDSATGLKVLTSSRSSLKSSDVEIDLIKESIHEDGLFYISSRAGFGSIDFDTLTYTVLDSGLSNSPINNISQHPDIAQSSVLFLGTNNGTYYSNNKGTSFSQVSTSTLDKTTIYDYLMISGDSTTVYAATSKGLYKSINSGTLFSQFASGGPGAVTTATRELHALAYDSGTFKLFSGFQGGLYSYDTIGASWSTILTATTNIAQISFAPSQSQTMFVLSTDFILSEDILVASPSFSNIVPVTAVSLSINDMALTTIQGRIYVASTFGILESTTQGSTYFGPNATASTFIDSNYTSLDVRASNPDQLIIGSSTKLFRISNTQVSPYANIDITNKIPPKINLISSPNTNASSVFVSAERWIYKFHHLTDTWELIANPTPLTTYTAIYAKEDTQKLWLGAGNDGLIHTNYDGTGSIILSLPVNEPTTVINSIFAHPNDSNILLIGLENYGLFFTSDNGTTLTSSNSGLIAQSIVDIDSNIDASLLFTITSTSIYSSSNLTLPAALIWTKQLCGFADADDLLISQKPSTQNTEIYIIAGGDIIFSSDQGASCATNTLSFTPNIHTAVEYSTATSRVFYIGTDQGLYKSYDLENGVFEVIPNNHKTNVLSIDIYKEDTYTIDLMIGTDSGAYLLHDVKP